MPLFIPGNVIESISLKSMRIISTSSENPQLSIADNFKSFFRSLGLARLQMSIPFQKEKGQKNRVPKHSKND